MDAFDVNLQIFNGAISGPEMRDSMYDCFALIKSSIYHYANKLSEIESKISKIEGGN